MGHKNLLQNTFYVIVPKTKKPHISLIYKVLLFVAALYDCFQGWKMGLEPTTFGTTIRRSNRLSYIHRVDTHLSYRDANVIRFFGPCKIFGLKIIGKMPRVTKWQTLLLLCHAKPAKRRLAHLLMDSRVRKRIKLIISVKLKHVKAMNVKPLSDRVLILPNPAEEKTAGGLIIPDTAKEKPLAGKVVAVGPGTSEVKMEVKVGDQVLYGKYAGQEIQVDGVDYLIMKQNDILAII